MFLTALETPDDVAVDGAVLYIICYGYFDGMVCFLESS
jgi:hypothetical protein